MTLSIHLPPEAERRLRETADRLRIPVDTLAAAALQDFVAGPAAEFEAAARRVLDKNHELYRRLA
jgi:predicted transcriptional regulator